jgi:DNA helicase HerA-like ATPase
MIIIDEAHNVLRGKIHEILSTIFREGRKFGLGLIVISQQISDEMSEYINNIGKIIIFRIVDMKTIEILQKILDDENISRDLLRLRELEFYYIDLTGERQIFRGKILRI